MSHEARKGIFIYKSLTRTFYIKGLLVVGKGMSAPE